MKLTIREVIPFHCVMDAHDAAPDCHMLDYSQCLDCERYQQGSIPPHYPVPATMAHVASYDYGRLGLFDLITAWRFDSEYDRDQHFYWQFPNEYN